MSKKLSAILLAFWLGSLWFVGISANVIFNTLEDKQLAGALAGKLFTIVSYIGIVSAVYLMLDAWLTNRQKLFKQPVFLMLLVMLLLTLVGHFGIQAILTNLKNLALPNNVMDSEYAKQFGMWHGVAGVIYLIECVLGVALLLKTRAN